MESYDIIKGAVAYFDFRSLGETEVKICSNPICEIKGDYVIISCHNMKLKVTISNLRKSPSKKYLIYNEVASMERNIRQEILLLIKERIYIKKVTLYALRGQKTRLINTVIMYRDKPIFLIYDYNPDNKLGIGTDGRTVYEFINLFQLYNHLKKLTPLWDKFIEQI